jgi:arylformamidase
MTTTTSTEWIALAQPLYTGMPAPGPSGAVSFSAAERPIKDNCTVRVTRLDMATHVGTHVDAANHFIPHGRSIDRYPLEKFVGPGIALDVRRTGPQQLDRDELDAVGADVQPGDIVLLSFGYGRHFGTDTYREHPYITVGAAEWLVEREVKLVGFDLMTPDMPEPLRPDGFDWPVHQVLLGHDVLVMENLNGALDIVTGQRLEIFAAPMPIKGADGGPCVPIVRVTP